MRKRVREKVCYRVASASNYGLKWIFEQNLGFQRFRFLLTSLKSHPLMFDFRSAATSTNYFIRPSVLTQQQKHLAKRLSPLGALVLKI